MEKLQELILERGVEVPKDLRQRVEGYGYNPDQLTDAEARVIADEVAPQNGLAVSNGKPVTPAKRGGGGRRKKITDTDPTTVLVNAAKKVEGEIRAYEQGLLANKPLYVDQRSTWIANEVLSTSADVAEAVTQKLNEAEAHPDSFRAAGGSAGNVFFPIEQPDAT